MAFTNSLLDATQEYYDCQRHAQKKAFEKAQIEWESEVHQAQREHRAPDSSKKPEEPKGKYLKTSATTSKSRLLEQLATNGELGCHMASTEINTLISRSPRTTAVRGHPLQRTPRRNLAVVQDGR